MSLNAYPYLSQSPAAPGAPLVFAFHGTGGDEHQFFGFLRDLVPQAGVISPRGDVSEHGANRFFRRTGEGVYDMEDLAERTEKMASFIAAQAAEYPQSPIVGLGYSNGANILASVILTHPGLIRRAVLMHPLIPWQPAPDPRQAGLDLLITAGARDPICPLPLSEALIGYFRAQGAQVAASISRGGHEVSQTEVAAIREFLKREILVV